MQYIGDEQTDKRTDKRTHDNSCHRRIQHSYSASKLGLCAADSDL